MPQNQLPSGCPFLARATESLASGRLGPLCPVRGNYYSYYMPLVEIGDHLKGTLVDVNVRQHLMCTTKKVGTRDMYWSGIGPTPASRDFGR